MRTHAVCIGSSAESLDIRWMNYRTRRLRYVCVLGDFHFFFPIVTTGQRIEWRRIRRPINVCFAFCNIFFRNTHTRESLRRHAFVEYKMILLTRLWIQVLTRAISAFPSNRMPFIEWIEVWYMQTVQWEWMANGVEHATNDTRSAVINPYEMRYEFMHSMHELWEFYKSELKGKMFAFSVCEDDFSACARARVIPYEWVYRLMCCWLCLQYVHIHALEVNYPAEHNAAHHWQQTEDGCVVHAPYGVRRAHSQEPYFLYMIVCARIWQAISSLNMHRTE